DNPCARRGEDTSMRGMDRRRLLLTIPLAAALAACGRRARRPANAPSRSALAGEGPVAAVADGATLALDSGLAVRPAGPQPPPGAPAQDRWGRTVARLTLPDADGLAVNRALVAHGAARVRPEDEEDAEARALLALEAAAREAGRGLWASPYYAVRPADAVSLA